MLLLSKDGQMAVPKAFQREVSNGRGINILITGLTQTGKSTISVIIAWLISNYRFNLNNDLTMIKVKPLLDKLDKKKNPTMKLYRGRTFVADDFGIGLSHREWFQASHKHLNQTMQTIGNEGLVFIINTPFISFIDKDTRLLIDYHITTLHFDKRRKYIKFKIEHWQKNEVKPDEVKTYKHYLRMLMPDRTIVEARSFIIYFDKFQDIIDEYHQIEKPAKDALHSSLNSEADQQQKEDMARAFNVEHYVLEAMKDSAKFETTWHGRKFISLERIKNEFGLGENRGKQVKAAIEQKLYGGNERGVRANASIQEGHGTADNTGTSQVNA